MELDLSLLWIPLTLAAAFLQNVRSALQKALKGKLGVTGATFVRFAYALPLAAAYVGGLVAFAGLAVPTPTATFAGYCLVGAIAQIAGTALLVSLFDQRNFAVATTYSKTETVQTALFAILFLDEVVSGTAALGIAISLAGVVAITLARSPGVPTSSAGGSSSWTGRPALFGLGSGAAFGIAAVSYRGASLSLGGDGFLMQSGLTLLVVLSIQSASMGTYMAWRKPEEIRACLATWRTSALVGLAGGLASAGWFTAMTLQSAPHVRALGQVELVFTLASSALFFKERIVPLEIAGISVVTLGILVLLLE